jgi:two-component system sensor histidine kinase YesM
LVALGLASSLIIAFLISVRTYQPIRGLLSLIEGGQPKLRGGKRQSSGSWNEMKYLAATIVQSQEQQKAMEEELERRYKMMSRAQAVALQAQINPHMLYNTLEAVNWKVMRLTGGKNEASAMVHALSRLLRLSLTTGDSIIPLQTELEHARLYVEVQQMHYKDELEVIWKINDGILEHMTVRLTLQPIIENAIYHGIKPSNRPGMITVTGYAGTNFVIVRIKDNGVGISPALADRINQSFASPHIRESDHIGLSNVNQRIRLIFGEAFGLRITGVEGQGTIVEMRLPKRK